MKEDDYVKVIDHPTAVKLGLSGDTNQAYVITKVIDGRWLGLSGPHAINGIIYHKRFFERTGKVAPAKWICLTTPALQPWMKVGEIYDGTDVGENNIHVVTPARSVYVNKTGFSKVRNWDEAKHVYDMMHQANIENALKFVDWNDDKYQINAGDSEKEDSSS